MEKFFDNWKDSPGGLTFETLITILTIENMNSENHSYLIINCDTGQHSQFLRSFANLTGLLIEKYNKIFCRINIQSFILIPYVEYYRSSLS